jgi:hypothetical protein
LIVTGCESTRDEIGIDEVDSPDTTNEAKVKQQRFVAIIPHISSLACTKGGIDTVLKNHHYAGNQYEYTQEPSDITCSHFPDTDCRVLNGLEEGEVGYSEYLSCVVGTNDKVLENP